MATHKHQAIAEDSVRDDESTCEPVCPFYIPQSPKVVASLRSRATRFSAVPIGKDPQVFESLANVDYDTEVAHKMPLARAMASSPQRLQHVFGSTQPQRPEGERDPERYHSAVYNTDTGYVRSKYTCQLRGQQGANHLAACKSPGSGRLVVESCRH